MDRAEHRGGSAGAKGAALVGLAALTLRQCRRARFVAALAVTLLAALTLAEFGASLAPTETEVVRLVLFGAVLRLGLVVLIAAQAVQLARADLTDGLFEFIEARGVPRWQSYAGRALGLVALSALAALPLLPLAWLLGAEPTAAAGFALALGAELALLALTAQAAVVTLREPALALLAVGAFYLFARSGSAVLAMATHPDALPSLARDLLLPALAALTRLAPALDGYAASARLLGDLGLPGGGSLLLDATAFALLVFALGAVDYLRRVE